MYKKIAILLLFTSLLSISFAETMNISDVHANFDSLKNNNSIVNIIGVVTAKYNDKTVVIQDKTAGIWLYDNKGRFSNVTIGDKLNITGSLSMYNGLREVNLVNISKLSKDNDLPDPKIVNIKDIANNKSMQGTLVKLYKVIVSDVKGKSFKISDETGSIKGYGKYGNIGVSNGNIVDLIAVVGCYNGNQVNPRSNKDFKIYPKTEKVIYIPLGKVKFGNNATLKLNYGIGSAAFYRDGKIYTMTDRGPNIKVKDSKEILGTDLKKKYELDNNGKIFPISNFTPTIFVIDPSSYSIIKNITIKDKEGKPITGLPNPIPSTETAYDKDFKELNPDPNGIDSEGMVVLSDGTFWISEEYAPSLLHVAANGSIIERIVPKGLGRYYKNATYKVVEGLPSIISKRHLNRGIEALAVSPDEKYLYFALQSPIDNPDKDNYKSSRIIRLYKFDLNNKSIVGEYVYTIDKPKSFSLDSTKKQKKVKVSEMTCVGEDELVILERVSNTAKLYYVKLNGTNIYNTKWDNLSTQNPCLDEIRVNKLKDYNITPLQKICVFDNGKNNLTLPSKIEGIASNGDIFYLLNDNDFGIRGDKSTISKVIVSIPNSNTTNRSYGNIFFIQFADIHLCNNSEVGSVFGGKIPPVSTTNTAVKEVIFYHPEAVVDTGDIVALADRYPLDTDERWYKLVNKTIYTPITKSGIPFLYAPGNHDPAGYRLSNVNKSDPRYYNGLLLKYLDNGRNKTYYSYDIGNYHFIMLDPLETKESGYRAVILPNEQLRWLSNDLSANKDKYIIVAYHQPLGSWESSSYNKFMNVISKYKGHILLIAGHTHDNRVIYRNGIPECQGGALCGDWWQTGKTPDGNPLGYVIYDIKNGTINRFYKGINISKQINILSPNRVVLNQSYNIDLNAYCKNKTVANISYIVDNRQQHPLNFTLINASKIWWYHASGTINPSLDNINHNITIIVKTADGSEFNKTIVYRFSKKIIMPVSKIIDNKNFDNYYGRFVTINGTITSVGANGNLLIITDSNNDSIVIWAGDCHHKKFEVGDKIILTGQVTQFRGTKELKLIKDEDAIVYGVKNMGSSLIVLPNISTAYNNFTNLKNKYVETKGVVTGVFSGGNLVVIQDRTRGICLWLGEINHSNLNIGDAIIIRGQLSTYNNMVEIVAGLNSDLIINGTGKVPEPKEITINKIPENLGNLVILKNLTVKSVNSQEIIVSDGTNTTKVWCGSSGFNPSKVVKSGDKLDIMGIAYVHKTTYELQPRDATDIIVYSNRNIKNNSFVINGAKLIIGNNTLNRIKNEVKIVKKGNITTAILDTHDGDELAIPIVSNESVNLTNNVIDEMKEIKKKALEPKNIEINDENDVDNIINSIEVKPILNKGFNITNITKEKARKENNRLISVIRFNAINTSDKGFSIIRIPIGSLNIENITLNNGTENITLKENDITNKIGWYRIPVEGVLEITLVKDPEVNIILSATLPTTTSTTTTSCSGGSGGHYYTSEEETYSDVASDIKSEKIKEIVHNYKLILGSEIDNNMSAKHLKNTSEVIKQPIDIDEDCILVGGPVANPLVKKYLWTFPVKVTNDYPGAHMGVIQKQIINGHNVILLAGSDRYGTKAAVEYFKTLDDIPSEPIFVQWKDNKAIKINKP